MAISAVLYAAHLFTSYKRNRWHTFVVSILACKLESERTSSYACKLALRSARVIILSGPSGPKFIADAFVASEKVGEGGPGD